MSSQNEQELVTKSFYNFHIKNTNENVVSDIILSNQVNKERKDYRVRLWMRKL